MRKKNEKKAAAAAAAAADAEGQDPKTLGGDLVEGMVKKFKWTQRRASLMVDNILFYAHPARHDEFDPLPGIAEDIPSAQEQQVLAPDPSAVLIKTAATGKVTSDGGEDASKKW